MQAAQEWVRWDPNPQTRDEVQRLIEENNEATLSELMSNRLKFGTAGLRGRMGAGYSRMNDLVVLQTAQGLCRYLEAQVPDAKARGVAIGYDHRQLGQLHSRGFARVTAAVALSQGFKVHACSRVVATPMLAYAVTMTNAAAGIMVTASHNPKADDGYKVYWCNGAQIIPPHDEGIAREIQNNLQPWQQYDTENIEQSELYHDVTDELTASYLAKVEALCYLKSNNQASPLRTVYTAMHGVGQPYFLAAAERFGHANIVTVAAQAEPNAEFPTVKFPNPEEKGALDLAMATGNAENCSLILANDPDADRLAVAEKLGDHWQLLTGNQIGIILGHYMFTRWQRAHPQATAEERTRVAMCASVVSSKMLAKIAEIEGFRFDQTLTGFKWLGNRTLELRQEGYEVLFAYEEALGYSVGDITVDKDGISAACVFAELANELATAGKTVASYMTSLYEKYGEFVSNNSYVICHDPAKIDAIFARLRNNGAYWDTVGGVRIDRIRDVTTGYSSQGSMAGLPVTPDSHMIMYDFSNGVSVTLRTSGTEPKIKYYAEMAGVPGQAREDVTNALNAFVEQMVNEMLQPEENGLARP